MFKIRLYKLSKEEGIEYLEEYFVTKHYSIEKREDFILLTLYDKYTKEKGVQYVIGENSSYDALFIKKDGETIYKYNSL